MTDRRLRVIAGGDEQADEVLALLDDTTIRIVLVGDQPSWSHQILLVSLVDLLGRLFPRIAVACSDGATAHPALPPGPGTLVERVAGARAHGGHELLPASDRAITVFIGPGGRDADFYVDGGGWWSYAGTEPSALPGDEAVAVPIGALSAACRIAAIVFARALSPLRPPLPAPRSVYASALEYRAQEEAPPPADVSALHVAIDSVLVGAGSIGGAAVYALAHAFGVRGSLKIVDPQPLEEQNLDRAILATPDETTAQSAKAEVARRALTHLAELACEAHVATIAEYLASLPRTQPLPLVLSAVDSIMARRSIQDCLPLEVLNAACHPHEVTISGHRTDDGPCLCCLHMPIVLDEHAVKMRMIARETGLNERMVTELLVQATPLNDQHIRGIERHRNLVTGSLGRFAGKPLEDLWRGDILYGAARVQTSQGTVAVAAPFVTALAGFLLAGELIKSSDPSLSPHRLGPAGIAIKYAESPYASPVFAQLSSPSRWNGSECLCRSTRRLRLMRQRYGLGPNQDASTL